MAVLIRILARGAIQLNESVDQADVEAIKLELTRMAGGPAGMKQLLDRSGMVSEDLDKWAENALFAVSQLRHIEEQVDIPSDREILDRVSMEGQEDPSGEVYDKYRQMILDERLGDTIGRWINEMLVKGRIRIMR